MNFISLGDISFKLFDFFKIKDKRFTYLDLKYVIYAQGKFGGPIALTSHPDNFMVGTDSNAHVSKNICLFRNDGSLIHSLSKEGLSKIVGLDFLDEEYLLVVMQEGSYMLIDPHKGAKRTYNFGSKFLAENIVEAKTVENSVIFYTLTKDIYRFYYVQNIFTPNYQQFSHSEIKTKPSFFLPISNKTSLSQKLECLVTDPISGVHRLVEEEDSMLLFGTTTTTTINLPPIKEIKAIAISPAPDVDSQMIAFLTKQNTIYFVAANFSDVLLTRELNIQDNDPKSHKKTTRLLWCGEDAVVLFQSKHFHIVTKDSIYMKSYSSGVKGLLPFQEVDGIKIVSNTKCEILRALPQYYVNVYKLNSNAKSQDLFEAYQYYESREANYENNILFDKEGLQEAVEHLIEAACFELNANEQIRLLKAAHYGKTFLNASNSTFDHNKFRNACNILRVINAMRNENISRTITYSQFNTLSEGEVIRILIRYQLFYLADEVCKFLNYHPKLVSQVYVSWACAKIESQIEGDQEPTDQQQEALAAIIYEKLKNEKNICFAEISRKAVEIGKNLLALRLLEKEKSGTKKIQVLLEMKNYALSLREALYSRDPNLVEMVIFKMEGVNEQTIWALLDKNSISRNILINHLKNFKPTSLDEYMMTYTKGDERGLYALKNAYSMDDLQKRAQMLKDFAIKVFKDKFLEDITKEHCEYLGYLAQKSEKSDKSNKSESKDLEIPLRKSIEDLLLRGKNDEAENLKKKFKMNDKTFYTLKARILLGLKKLQDFDNLLQDKNKKSATIPWFSVIDMLVEAEEYDRVEKYIIKLNEPDDEIAFLRMIKRYVAACEIAIQNKRFEVVEQILNNPTVDVPSRNKITEMMSNNKYRMTQFRTNFDDPHLNPILTAHIGKSLEVKQLGNTQNKIQKPKYEGIKIIELNTTSLSPEKQKYKGKSPLRVNSYCSPLKNRVLLGKRKENKCLVQDQLQLYQMNLGSIGSKEPAGIKMPIGQIEQTPQPDLFKFAFKKGDKQEDLPSTNRQIRVLNPSVHYSSKQQIGNKKDSASKLLYFPAEYYDFSSELKSPQMGSDHSLGKKIESFLSIPHTSSSNENLVLITTSLACDKSPDIIPQMKQKPSNSYLTERNETNHIRTVSTPMNIENSFESRKTQPTQNRQYRVTSQKPSPVPSSRNTPLQGELVKRRGLTPFSNEKKISELQTTLLIRAKPEIIQKKTSRAIVNCNVEEQEESAFFDNEQIEDIEDEDPEELFISNPIVHGKVYLLDSIYEGRPSTVFFQYPSCCKKTRDTTRTISIDEDKAKAYKLKYRSGRFFCVIQTFETAGFKITTKSNWNAMWGKLRTSQIKDYNKYQRINHFPGCWQLGRKDNMWRNVSRMKRQFPTDYDYIPNTYLLGSDYERFSLARENAENKTLWIMKPCASACGRGIQIINKKTKVKKSVNYLISDYIANPYLINGRKFDLRLYVLVNCFDPLKIYLHREGLVRFCTSNYTTDKKNLRERYVHLTNWSVNKHSNNFVSNEDMESTEASKWSFASLRKHFEDKNINFEELMNKIEDVIIKTIISAEPYMLHSLNHSPEHRNNCFEMFGFDVLLDSNLKPWLMEVNVCPSLNSSSELDRIVKTTVMCDIMNLIGIYPYEKKKYEENLKKKIPGSEGRKIIPKSIHEIQDLNDDNCLEKLSSDDFNLLFEFEEEYYRKGGFKRLYPNRSNIQYYEKYFEFPRYNNILLSKFLQCKTNILEKISKKKSTTMV